MSDISAAQRNEQFDEVAEHVKGSSNTGMRVSVIDRSTLMLASPSMIATINWRPEWTHSVVQFSVRKVSTSKNGATHYRYLVVAGQENPADTDPAETVTRYPEPVKVIAGFDEEFSAYELISQIKKAISRYSSQPGWVDSTSFPWLIRKVVDTAGKLAWIVVGVAVIYAVIFGATIAKRYGDLYVEHAHESSFSNRPAVNAAGGHPAA